jgi:hypothetical protein
MKDGSIKPLQQYFLDEGTTITTSDSHSKVNDMDIVQDSPSSDNILLSQAILNSLKKSSQMEDAPLSTANYKALQQLEKERVYTRILIRIRYHAFLS